MGDDGYTKVEDYGFRSTTRVNQSRLNRGGQLLVPQKGAPAQANTKAPFQKIMDDMKENRPLDTGLNSSGNSGDVRETRDRPVDPVAHEDRPSDRETSRSFRKTYEKKTRAVDRDSDHRKAKSSQAEGEKPKGKIAEQKVIAKSPLSDRQRDGKGKEGSKDGSPNHWQGNKLRSGVISPELIGLQKGKIQELGQGGFMAHLKRTQAAFSKKTETPTLFTKELLDQIVQYVRLLTKTNGEKEIDVSLHEKVFKGLRLRVAMKDSKAEVNFLTSSSEVRELFLVHRQDLEKALAEKGIEVRRINVTII